MARPPAVLTGVGELLFVNIFPAARHGVATRECVRRLKKGVRLWLFAMAKG